MPRQKPKVGDVFWLPLEDGFYALGQVVEIEPSALNSITCAFYACRSSSADETNGDFSKLISVQFVTPDAYKRGAWVRYGNEPVRVQDHQLPYRETKSSGWVGAKIIGSGIIKGFLSAFYGLRDWYEMHDPDYYQKLLLPGVTKHGNA